VEPNLLCLIVTSSSCCGRSRWHNPTSTTIG
jgi:hypothetical protein